MPSFFRSTMVSNSSDSSSPVKLKFILNSKWDEDDALLLKINQLKREIQAKRVDSIKDKVEKNREKLLNRVSQVVLTTVKPVPFTENNKGGRMLFSRIQNPLIMFSGFSHESREKEIGNIQDVSFSMSTKLPKIENIPSYTTWIFLDGNQRMAENQSVVGRRRIYYDRYGSEALICSDSEEESPEPEEEKYEFCEGEDRIIWLAFEEHGPTQEVVNVVSQFTGGTNIEIQERYATLKSKYLRTPDHTKDSADIRTEKNILQDRSLGAALDSFDNLFCRRCLVFDCHLHGCSQNLIYPIEKQSSSFEFDVDGKPCSDECHLRLRADKNLLEDSVCNTSCIVISSTLEERVRTPLSSNFKEGSEAASMGTVPDQVCVTVRETTPASKKANGCSEVNDEVSKVGLSTVAMPPYEILGKRKLLKHTNMILQDSDSLNKKPKLILSSNAVPVAGEVITNLEHVTRAKNQQLLAINEQNINKRIRQTQRYSVSASCVDIGDNADDEARVVKEIPNENDSSRSAEQKLKETKMWKPIEKDLYLKGVEMFGRNSCLIAKNLLSGLKTCIEVSSYMYDGGSALIHGSSVAQSSYLEEDGKTSAENAEKEMRTKSRLFRRRGRAKKLKYSWKSTGLPSVWKRIADGKNQSCKQYTPCGCQSMCGKKCSCLHNGTCCEKYCGCSKSCKNRFRGCHCAKSQCRSRQCPCFAAGRECDPDVCKNCWVSCGDETLGEPPRQGDGQCGNMRLLLRQQQKILLGKSDVAGWGAFIKKSVNKNDYLGEYTGELISHREADKRGKIYDRANSSFLFDLNDQCVLDAYRKGDKLKFANHSSNPNCYAKVMFVAGDHRVGIFAKEHIGASEELFYDYQYGPNEAPVWARKPDTSKREESSTSHGRAKKHQSHY